MTIKETVQQLTLKYLRENYRVDEAKQSGQPIILDGKAVRNAVISKELQDSFSYKVTPKLFAKWAQECIDDEPQMKGVVEIRHICRYRKRKPSVQASPQSVSLSPGSVTSVGSVGSVEKPPTPPEPLTQQQLQLLLSNPKAVSPPVQQPMSQVVRARGDYDQGSVSYLQQNSFQYSQGAPTKDSANWKSRFEHAMGIVEKQRHQISFLKDQNSNLMQQLTKISTDKACLQSELKKVKKELALLKQTSLKRKRVEQDPLSPLIQPPQKRFMSQGRIAAMSKSWAFVQESVVTQLKLEDFQEGEELLAVVTDLKTNKTDMFSIGLKFSGSLNVNLPLGTFGEPTTLAIAIKSSTRDYVCPSRQFEIRDRMKDDCFGSLETFQLDISEEEKDIKMQDCEIQLPELMEGDDFWKGFGMDAQQSGMQAEKLQWAMDCSRGESRSTALSTATQQLNSTPLKQIPSQTSQFGDSFKQNQFARNQSENKVSPLHQQHVQAKQTFAGQFQQQLKGTTTSTVVAPQQIMQQDVAFQLQWQKDQEDGFKPNQTQGNPLVPRQFMNKNQRLKQGDLQDGTSQAFVHGMEDESSDQSPRQPRRVALVIGVSDYQKMDTLQTSIADSEMMKRTLKSMDYQVNVLHNPNKVDIEKKLSELSHHPIDQLVVHYAGHGVDDFICPVGFDKENKVGTGMTYQAFMNSFPEATNTMVFLDCCNSDKARYTGLANDNRKIHVVAAAQDKCLEDDTNGLFTRELSQAMRTSHGKSFEEIFDSVKNQVRTKALHYGINQTPLYFSVGKK